MNSIYAISYKRMFDIILSAMAIVILLPVYTVLTIVGAIEMKGNPFFVQPRPGKIDKTTRCETIFKLIKFRSMTCEKDKDGNLLPDADRLTKYGEFIRKTSLDELPEFFNVLKGDMSLVGPRPLLIEYLPWYTKQERYRHCVRPGITGWAQVNGRNSSDWNERLRFDIEYVKKISLLFDIKILMMTIKMVITQNGVSVDTSISEGNLAEIRKNKKQVRKK